MGFVESLQIRSSYSVLTRTFSSVDRQVYAIAHSVNVLIVRCVLIQARFVQFISKEKHNFLGSRHQ